MLPSFAAGQTNANMQTMAVRDKNALADVTNSITMDISGENKSGQNLRVGNVMATQDEQMTTLSNGQYRNAAQTGAIGSLPSDEDASEM